MNKIKVLDIALNKLSKLEPLLKTELLKIEGLVLGGGALRTIINKAEDILDYDLFVVGNHDTINTVLAILKDRFTKTFECPEGKLYSFKDSDGNKFQLINLRPYTDEIDLINSFDLNACRFVYNGEKLFTVKEAIRDVRKKVLSLHKLTYPVSTLNRIYKYRLKGYNAFECTKEFVFMTANGDFSLEDLELVYVD